MTWDRVWDKILSIIFHQILMKMTLLTHRIFALPPWILDLAMVILKDGTLTPKQGHVKRSATQAVVEIETILLENSNVRMLASTPEIRIHTTIITGLNIGLIPIRTIIMILPIVLLLKIP